MTAWQAGLIQSACHVGFLISLFCLGFLSDRYGARRIYLASSLAAVISTLLFAFFANGFWSRLLLYGSHRTDHLGLGELLGPWAIWHLRKCRKHGPLAGGKR